MAAGWLVATVVRLHPACPAAVLAVAVLALVLVAAAVAGAALAVVTEADLVRGLRVRGTVLPASTSASGVPWMRVSGDVLAPVEAVPGLVADEALLDRVHLVRRQEVHDIGGKRLIVVPVVVETFELHRIVHHPDDLVLVLQLEQTKKHVVGPRSRQPGSKERPLAVNTVEI